MRNKLFLSLLLFLVSANTFSKELMEWVKKKSHPYKYPVTILSLKEKSYFRSEINNFLNLRSFTFPMYRSIKIKHFAIIHDPQNIYPTLIINTTGTKDFIIEAPHAGLEKSTKKQAILLLQSLNAKAALISGANRCSSPIFSKCSGTTTVCGKRAAYRISDSAHSKNNLFQLIHEQLFHFFKNAKFIQLHEMKKTQYPYKIIISSTSTQVNSEKNFSIQVRDKIRKFYQNDNIAVSCNSKDDSNKKFRKLCGITNLQGRYTNNSKDICLNPSSFDSNRFIHLEQDYSITLSPKYIQALTISFKSLYL